VARYTDSKCRLCRREGLKLFLKGDRCYSEKCALDRRSYVPGQYGQGCRKRFDYGVQLREKQKVKRTYGVLERQFRLYFAKASLMKGVTGENLLSLLERRLDNTVYRMGWAASRAEARQIVRHRHLAVNGVTVDIPSFQVRQGDEITVRANSKEHPRLKLLIEGGGRPAPAWLDVPRGEMKAKVVALPTREDAVVDVPVQESLIVELYSK